jgi:(p)ppGpp synthase/HD superfamily hydrolase
MFANRTFNSQEEYLLYNKIIEKVEKILSGDLTLDKALLLAVVGHAGQEDKGQNSYIRHPLRVMEKMDSEDEMIVAVCHDLVEDTDFSLEELSTLGFTASQVKAIDALTKRDDEEYAQRIERVSNSIVARKIKVADIQDNLQVWRLKNKKLTQKDMDRMQHYIDALIRLGEI